MILAGWFFSVQRNPAQNAAHNLAISAILFALLMLAPAQPLKSQTWEAVDASGAVTVYARDVAGSGIDEFRGVTVVPADLEAVLSTLNDTGNVKRWLDRCIQSQKLNGQIDERYEAYLRFDMVFPLSDRDVIVSMTRTEAEPHRVVYEGRKVTGRYPEQAGAIRMPDLRTRWVLERVDGGTRISYEHYADPGGDIAAWLVNPFSAELVLNTLTNLSAYVR